MVGTGPRGSKRHVGGRLAGPLSPWPVLSLVCEWGQALNSLFLRDIMELRAKVEDN